MSSGNHLAVVLRGAASLGAWRLQHPHVRIELAHALLERANLSACDLRGADLRQANLRYANLRGADLRRADLRSADLTGADLRDADLRGANLRLAGFDGANTEGARFDESLAREHKDAFSREAPAHPRGGIRRDDDVRFSAYHPQRVAQGQPAHLLVFAHTMSSLSEVHRLAEKELAGEAPQRRAVSRDACPVPRGSVLTLAPEVAGVHFEPQSQRLTWDGEIEKTCFSLTVAAGSKPVLSGHVDVYLGAILVSQIELTLRLECDRREVASSTAGIYRKIFASYSHKDSEIIERVEQYAIALGDEYLRDVRSLRAGEVWTFALRDLVDEADVFQLFWSRNSMISPYVRQEWEYALSLRRPYFLRPAYWERPMPRGRGLPPPRLAALHFQYLDLRGAQSSPLRRIFRL